MSDRSHIRWLLLFGVMILVPAAVLTVMSVRTLVDDEHNTLADLQLRLPAVRAEVDRLVRTAIDSDETYTTLVTLRFRVNSELKITDPPFRTLAISERRGEHLATVVEGRRLMNTGDVSGAAALYESAQETNLSPEEDGELHNLLAQAYAVEGRVNDVRHTYHTLMQSPGLFDADGAHLASMFPGVREYFKMSRRIGGYGRGFREGHDRIATRLSRRAQFLEEFERLQPSGSVPMMGSFVCGTYDDGRTGLAFIFDGPDGFDRDGIVLDVRAISRRVAKSLPTAVSVELFDFEALQDVDRRRQRSVRTIGSGSDQVSRLNAIVYAETGSPLGALRQRRFLAFFGVLAMALTIGAGVWLVYTNTIREMELAQMRSDLVSNVSHELRTPLQSIQMHAETLSMGRYRDEDQHQRYLDTITHESNRLSRMVSNVLDFSRLEGGRLHYEMSDLNLSRVVGKTTEDLEPSLHANGFILIRAIDDDLHVRGDAEHIDSAVGNLIGNAVKYSGGEKEIYVKGYASDVGAVIEVQDRGIGVPEGDRRTIFDRFRRASNAGDATGAGLGLALVKDVMAAHAGRVTVSDHEGGGSVFKLEFPRVRV